MANQQNDIPTFTPPVQTFTPPSDASGTRGGPSCHFHKGEPAVAKCAKCGKLLCQDCVDSYGVSGGEYAGEALCYDCCQELVAAIFERKLNGEFCRTKEKSNSTLFSQSSV